LETEKEQPWQQLPPLVLPSPVFALAAWRETLWAGGVGGVARCTLADEQATWAPEVSTLLLAPVTTLLALEDLLLAGGGGGIAYSYDKGASWRQAQLEEGVVAVTAFAASPAFASDHTIVAATLDRGLLRTSDGGHTWTSASFGLGNLAVTALLWVSGATVLAATGDGIYRSGDAGRGWRLVYPADELDIESFVLLADQTILAMQSNGELLRSRDGGKRWSPQEAEARDIQVSACLVTPAGTLLLGTLEHGLLRSEDAGANWQVVYARTVYTGLYLPGCLYVGTEAGVSYSLDDGLSWREFSAPPVHDVRTLLAHSEQLVLSGMYSGALVLSSSSSWARVANVPQPLTACALTPAGDLLLSGPEGLTRLSLAHGARQSLLEGAQGQVAHLAMRQQGDELHIWAASADGARLLRSTDSGAHWQQLAAPFGILPLVALQAVADRLLAATYDPRQYRVCLWYSADAGEHWVRSIEAETNWPLVASCAQPAAFSIGNVLFLEQAPAQWRRGVVSHDGGAVRRVLGFQQDGVSVMLALTTGGIQRSDDGGETWRLVSADLPGDQILDIALTGTTLYVLLTAGRVCWQVLQEERQLV
jgi:photosystem II stability/assembly factor-like uncharacterized protein